MTGEPKPAEAPKKRSCSQCKWPLAEGTGQCSRCGWDIDRVTRLCLSCRGFIGAVPDLPGGTTAGGIIVAVGMMAGFLAGCLGSLAVGFALSAIGGLIAFFTLAQRCKKCLKVLPDHLLSAAERDEVKTKRGMSLMGSLGMGAASLICAVTWLIVVTSPAKVPFGDDPTGPEPDIEAFAAKGASGVPDLVKSLRDSRVSVRATDELVKIGPPAAEPLLKAMNGSDELLSDRAAEALRQLGPAAGGVAVEVADSLRIPRLRPVASDILERMGEAAVIPLMQALADADSEVRKAAADALEKVEGLAPESRPAIERAAKDAVPAVRISVVRVLARYADDGLPALMEALQDPEADVRYAAVTVLARMKGTARPALPALQKMAESDADERVRTQAKSVIPHIGR